jgi:hypothetical protein
MIVRRGRASFTVRLEVPHTGGLRAWGAVADDFERWLAEQVSPVVSEARVESETRRGPDSARVRILVTVRAADVGQAAVIAWDVFRAAAGDDIAAWDMNVATAEVRPADNPLCPRLCCIMTVSPAGSAGSQGPSRRSDCIDWTAEARELMSLAAFC